MVARSSTCNSVILAIFGYRSRSFPGDSEIQSLFPCSGCEGCSFLPYKRDPW
ncbi:hypothetical protein BDV18DRAFT_103495 [Aspergillus unguis]